MLFVMSLLFAQSAGCDPKNFITHAYQDVLGRPIDASGQTYWLGQMKDGATRTQVANKLLRSAEHSDARVQNMFNAYLHRLASSSDLNVYSAMLQHGTPAEDVRTAILASPEYFHARGGETDAGFVAALYEDVLGTVAETRGAASLTQQLQNGAQRSAIAHQFVTSPEARARWMNVLYNTYLHRAAPRAAPSGGEDQITVSILASEEYCRR